MRRATVTLPDDLEALLDEYLARLDAPPSLTTLVQAALRQYLEEAPAVSRTRDETASIVAEETRDYDEKPPHPEGLGESRSGGQREIRVVVDRNLEDRVREALSEETLRDTIEAALLQALRPSEPSEREQTFHGFEPLPPRGRAVSNATIDRLRDEENV